MTLITKALLALIPVSMALDYWCFDPFEQILVSNSVPLHHLGAAQRSNIELAAHAVDGAVLAPGQTFSFNQIVGPRTAERAYCQAPSYLGDETPITFGGGVCLLSSLLYKSALELGLNINERHAHTRTVQTVPAGFDATVWYGSNQEKCDLKFTNNCSSPLQIKATTDSDRLKIALLGPRNPQPQLHKTALKRLVNPSSNDRIEVTVIRNEETTSTQVSRNFYCLPQKANKLARLQRQRNHLRKSG